MIIYIYISHMTANIYKQHALEGCLQWETCSLLRRKNAWLSSQHCSTSKANLQNNQHPLHRARYSCYHPPISFHVIHLAPVTSSLTAVAPRIEAKPCRIIFIAPQCTKTPSVPATVNSLCICLGWITQDQGIQSYEVPQPQEGHAPLEHKSQHQRGWKATFEASSSAVRSEINLGWLTSHESMSHKIMQNPQSAAAWYSESITIHHAGIPLTLHHLPTHPYPSHISRIHPYTISHDSHELHSIKLHPEADLGVSGDPSLWLPGRSTWWARPPETPIHDSHRSSKRITKQTKHNTDNTFINIPDHQIGLAFCHTGTIVLLFS